MAQITTTINKGNTLNCSLMQGRDKIEFSGKVEDIYPHPSFPDSQVIILKNLSKNLLLFEGDKLDLIVSKEDNPYSIGLGIQDIKIANIS